MGRESLERLRLSRAGRNGRPFAGRGQEPVLLACTKCQSRLEKAGRFGQARELRKALDLCTGRGLRVLEVECLDVCPEHAVTVCAGARAGRASEITVVRSAADLNLACDRALEAGDWTEVPSGRS